MSNTPIKGIRICIIHFKCKHFGFLLFTVDISNLTVTLPAVNDRDIVLNMFHHKWIIHAQMSINSIVHNNIMLY